jgi:tetratricopeptide (TPR) repeat protein
MLAGAIALAGLAGFGGYTWWRGEQQQAIVEASLPPAPDLSSWLPEFQHRVATAERRARAGEHPVEALVELSRLYHANGFLAEAAQCYETLQHLQPREPHWPHRHASILAGYGQADAAIELWRRTLSLAPNYTPARLRLADVLLKAEETTEAAQAYQEVLRRQPNEPYAQLGLARIDFEAGRWVEARDRLERIVAQTNYQLGYDLIVSVYERLGQHDRAAAVRGQMLASGAYRDPPDPWMDELWDESYDLYQLSLTAGVAERAGDVATAVRRLERALRLDPHNYSIHYQLGLTYQAMRENARARQHLERATVLEPKFSDAWSHLSSMLAVSGDLAAANRILAEGLRHNPNSYGLRLMRARRFREAGRMPEAIRDYQAAIAQRPSSAEAYIELALVYLRLERIDEGVAELGNALVAEPEHPTALTTLALHSISTGDEPAARHWLQRMREQPRVPREQLQSLLRGYQEQFGTRLN